MADDLLILCPDAEEAHKVRKARLRPAAMPLKGTLQTANRDLASGESASWLGYDLCRGEQGGQARLHDDAPAWDRLRDHLLDTHERPDVRAGQADGSRAGLPGDPNTGAARVRVGPGARTVEENPRGRGGRTARGGERWRLRQPSSENPIERTRDAGPARSGHPALGG